jgi:glycosyltransferase involved in cell wall biosynthesis
MGYGTKEYQELIGRFRKLVRSSVPERTTVLVVSKGDHELLDLGIDRTWHFPQRADGTYAGYYPFDSASAIAHLEALREKGGKYLAFPAPSLWWLDHYKELRLHLESHGRAVGVDKDVGVVYALGGAGTNGGGKTTEQSSEAPSTNRRQKDPGGNGKAPTGSGVAAASDRHASTLEILLSLDYYGEQIGMDFDSPEQALRHYEQVGQREGLNPHPLFDTRWYLARYPEAGAEGSNPLTHFIEHSVEEGQDPNPYFDTEYYYSQVPRYRAAGGNALAHYVDPETRAAHPNPLFREGFYRDNSRKAKTSAPIPLEHFLHYGRAEGRAMSHVHEKLLAQVRGECSSLHRGKWTKGTVLWFTKGPAAGRWPGAPAIAERLAAEHHLGSLVSCFASPSTADGLIEPFVLEDYVLACEIFRPSALRLLSLALTSPRPLFAVCDVPEVLETLSGNGVDCYFLFPDDARALSEADIQTIGRHSKRVLVSSKARTKTIAKRLRRLPCKVSTCAPAKVEAPEDGYADSLLKLARRDFVLPAERPSRKRPRKGKPKIIIPCSDWSVSGVNASMESIGLQLKKLGWDIEVIFTRDEAAVLESADGNSLPLLPYRYLERERKGPNGVWHALIGELEVQSPCILFMAYDFLANGVVPALSEKIGAVTWVQADDRDYYEQVYRLGRYCNAIVCVSEVIRDRVSELNPVIGERAHVIHNSSVSRDDVVRRRRARGDRMRLAYTGRLVQYQKRVLDFVDLAQALDRTGVPYEITLIGTFSGHDGVQEEFERLAAPHIEDGRIRLPGRMSREEILRELSGQDFFVLLSDFEGLPLSLVEAMARGCVPVVAESPSGIPEILESGENGYIVRGRDYDAWAALLAGVWKDREAHATISRNARQTVTDRFTVEHVGAQFDELFGGVAREISSGRYERPRSLNWGGDRSHAGDVLPPPNLFRPASLQMPGLQ